MILSNQGSDWKVYEFETCFDIILSRRDFNIKLTYFQEFDFCMVLSEKEISLIVKN